jgi:hypothetical protein
MNAVIEMHDSECLAIELDENEGGYVLLDAYVHRGDGDPMLSRHTDTKYNRIPFQAAYSKPAVLA